mgnify:CR=1 FL=1
MEKEGDISFIWGHWGVRRASFTCEGVCTQACWRKRCFEPVSARLHPFFGRCRSSQVSQRCIRALRLWPGLAGAKIGLHMCVGQQKRSCNARFCGSPRIECARRMKLWPGSPGAHRHTPSSRGSVAEPRGACPAYGVVFVSGAPAANGPEVGGYGPGKVHTNKRRTGGV